MTTSRRTQTRFAIGFIQWVGPLALSGFVSFGVFQFSQGTQAQKIATVERDVSTLSQKIDATPSREELRLILEDLKEIKTDVREIRRNLTR